MNHDVLWISLIALGAYHGLNPAMGWLFAVSQGMQHRSRKAVLQALLPIAIGHELSIAVVAILALSAAAIVDPSALRIGAAIVLVAFGIWRFAKPHAHPRWTRMRVNRRELAWWSFLMSSAHGAGLMVAPLLVGLGSAEAATAHDKSDMAMVLSDPSLLVSAGAIAVHVGAMLVVMAVVAVVVYERLGLEMLRRTWFNTDKLWAATFVMAGGLTLVT